VMTFIAPPPSPRYSLSIIAFHLTAQHNKRNVLEPMSFNNLRRNQTICTDKRHTMFSYSPSVNVPFITSLLSAVAVTECVGECRLSTRQSCSVQGHDKRDSVYSWSTDAVVNCSCSRSFTACVEGLYRSG
jgi:hypothetical protein